MGNAIKVFCDLRLYSETIKPEEMQTIIGVEASESIEIDLSVIPPRRYHVSRYLSDNASSRNINDHIIYIGAVIDRLNESGISDQLTRQLIVHWWCSGEPSFILSAQARNQLAKFDGFCYFNVKDFSARPKALSTDINDNFDFG